MCLFASSVKFDLGEYAGVVRSSIESMAHSCCIAFPDMLGALSAITTLGLPCTPRICVENSSHKCSDVASL